MATPKKRILIDANPVVPFLACGRNTGIGRTCMELILSLDKIRDSLPFEIEMYTQNLSGVSGRRLETGFKSHHIYLRNTSTGRAIAKATGLRELSSHYDLQHITHNYENVRHPERCIVTVHDAFFMKIEDERFNFAKLRKLYPPFIRRARHIITCSEYSKKDIIETMGIPPEKITVIPWGVDHDVLYPEKDLTAVAETLKNDYGIERPFFLSVSCDAGRKRTPALIEAYNTLPNPTNDLVLVWGNPPHDITQKYAGNSRIHFLKNIPNDALRLLYNGATASVNPTSYEGFGLPVLEAMACGCIAVTCRNSSLPEVGGDVAIYMDEPIEKSLPKMLRQLDSSEFDYSERKAAGIARASQFTWARTAQLTAEVYARQLQE